jgi:hypothetical protein
MVTKRELRKRNADRIDNQRYNLLRWLNQELPRRSYSKAARQRIEQLIESLQKYARLLKCGKQDQPAALYASTILVDLIHRYPSRPLLGQDGRNLVFSREPMTRTRAEEWEAFAADAAMDLAEFDGLSTLRRCQCVKWFFARKKDQKSCSPKCRHKLYEQTEAFKAKRRKYMKKYMKEYKPLKASGKVK